jgi:hypothetical protein
MTNNKNDFKLKTIIGRKADSKTTNGEQGPLYNLKFFFCFFFYVISICEATQRNPPSLFQHFHPAPSPPFLQLIISARL